MMIITSFSMRKHYDKISLEIFSLLLITIPYYLKVDNPWRQISYLVQGINYQIEIKDI
jgi:hypothetical protein